MSEQDKRTRNLSLRKAAGFCMGKISESTSSHSIFSQIDFLPGHHYYLIV